MVNVDNLIITGDNESMISKAKEVLHRQLNLKNLEEIKYFIGIEVLRLRQGVILNQRKYILEKISENSLVGVKPATTPQESNIKLTSGEYDKAVGSTDDAVLKDATSYQRLVGKLMYATINRPHISYVAYKLSQFMKMLKRYHLEASYRWSDI